MAIAKSVVRAPEAAHEDPIVASVRSIVSSHPGAGYPNLPAVARMAGVPVRTLQRHLASAGLTYSDLLIEVRLGRARELLGEKSVPIDEIAASLGYSNAANFTRAFKKWAGVTPTRYRRSVTTGPRS